MNRTRKLFQRIHKFLLRFSCTAADGIVDLPSDCYETKIEQIYIRKPSSPQYLSVQRPVIFSDEHHRTILLPGVIQDNSETLTVSEISKFYQLLEDDVIKRILEADKGAIIADKYLLAMTLLFFKRAGLTLREYTRSNFFAALYLAHHMEEDNDLAKKIMLISYLGTSWKQEFKNFFSLRDDLLKRMDYRAYVTKATCEEVMIQHIPVHWAWKRQRSNNNLDNVIIDDFLT